MQNFTFIAVLTALLVMTGCQSVGIDSKQEIEFHYDYVANIQNTIQFETAVPLSPPLPSTNQVISRWLGGFWAVFVLCSLDVQGTESFTYDRGNFYVEYGGKTYGALQPFTLITTTEDDIGPKDTSIIENTILNTIGWGPSTQVFAPGLHLSLNYRTAIFISDPTAADKGLTLRYKDKGHPSILRELGHSPVDLPSYISSSAPPLPRSCRASSGSPSGVSTEF